MTARPWGTTGRVTLKQYIDTDGEPWPDWDVRIDGRRAGRVQMRYVEQTWTPETLTAVGPIDLPTLDAAVMWVIRRADAEVWRQERGPIRRVERSLLWSTVGMVHMWLVTDPSHDRGDRYTFRDWSLAVETARRSAKAEVPTP